MAMDDSTLAYAMGRDSSNGDGFGFGGGGAWLIWIVLIFAMFGGWGGGGWGGGMSPAMMGMATQADVNAGFAMSSLQSGQNNLREGQFGLQSTLCQNQFNILNGMIQGFDGVTNGITSLGYQTQEAINGTNRNLDQIRYDMAKNTCDVIQAGNANTQRILDMMTADKIDSLRSDLQTANNALAIKDQTSTLIGTLRPTPTPSYIVSSPYQSIYNGTGYGYSGYGYGYPGVYA